MIWLFFPRSRVTTTWGIELEEEDDEETDGEIEFRIRDWICEEWNDEDDNGGSRDKTEERT